MQWLRQKSPCILLQRQAETAVTDTTAHSNTGTNYYRLLNLVSSFYFYAHLLRLG